MENFEIYTNSMDQECVFYTDNNGVQYSMLKSAFDELESLEAEAN